jgi:proteasome alpha subunit
MSMPFYVSPEQQMKDRADFARKGIARGRNVIVVSYAGGIALVAENSRTLRKISEIYDRIAFAAVGRYNEFENLRIAGVRMADVRGYSYARSDVSSRNLANSYAQVLGTIFSAAQEKPYEVELVVAEVASSEQTDQIYRLTFDGSITDEDRFAVMGGSAEALTEHLREVYRDGLDLSEALALAVSSFERVAEQPAEGARQFGARDLEVAVLDRTRPHLRKFKRLEGAVLQRLIDGGRRPAEAAAAPEAESPPPPEPPVELNVE